MYQQKKIAKIIPYKKAYISLSPTTMLDVEIVKIFEQSLAEDVPYMIELHNTRFADWIERHKEYWEKNRNLRITFHTPTHNVWAIPIR